MMFITYTIYKTRQNRYEGFKLYSIKKGKHYSKCASSALPFNFKISQPDIYFSAMFGMGTDVKTNSYHINKLYGVSYGFDHHYRSVRIGWNYNSVIDKIDLYLYYYVNGKRGFQKIMSVPQYEEVIFTIQHFEKERRVAVMTTHGENQVIKYISSIDIGIINFKLFPYYGGTETAPNNIHLYIKEN